MTTFLHRVLMIVRAEDRERANAVARSFDRTGGQFTFTVGLSASGQAPATHHWCSAQVRAETWTAIQALLPAFPGATFLEWNLATEPNKPDAVLAELGLQRLSSQPA